MTTNRISELDFSIENVLQVGFESQKAVLKTLAVKLSADIFKPIQVKIEIGWEQIINSKFSSLFFLSLGLSCPKKVYHAPVGQKLREEINFLETGHFWPRTIPLRLADLRPHLKITYRELD
jgi:hypothetical protein